MKIGILGLGSIGRRHALNFNLAGAEVIGFDPSEASRALAAAAGIELAGSRGELLSSIEALCICTPSALHLADLAEAVKARLPAMIEKPVAHSAEEFEPLLNRAEQQQVLLFAGFNLRYDAVVERARALLQKHVLGDILWARFEQASYLPDWRPGADWRVGYAADPKTGGVIFDVVHEIDLAWHLLGRFVTVAAVASRSPLLADLPSEHLADIIVRHDSGVQSTIHLDYLTRPRRRGFLIIGAEASLAADIAGRRLVITDRSGAVLSEENIPGHFADSYVEEARHFVDCVAHRSSPRCDGRTALDVLRQTARARDLAGLPQ